VDTLIEAAGILPEAQPLHIVLCGVPDAGYDVAGEIRARHLEGRCTLLPVQEPAVLSALVRGALGVVVPSRRDSIPLVLGEAVQLGTPVLCSDLPDLCAVLSRYRVGEVFSTGNAKDLARALQGFKTPPRFAADAARLLAEFSPGAAADSFLDDVVRLTGKGANLSVRQVRGAAHA
jgi:glycosyltransferase involved in cell wall biosynthesis